jgi:hypothetical protein
MSFRVEDRGNGIIWIRLGNREYSQKMYDISRWCRENNCGKQVSIHTISFNKDEELTMFLLRWQAELQ